MGGIYHHYKVIPPIKIIVVLMSFKPKLDSEASQNKLGRYSDHKVSLYGLYGSYPVYCQEVFQTCRGQVA